MTPIFERKQFSATIKENLEISTEKLFYVMRIEARDDDIGEFGRIRYFINKNKKNDNNGFNLDEKTGVLTLKKSLDRELTQEHTFEIKAVDGGELFTTGITKIFVAARIEL